MDVIPTYQLVPGPSPFNLTEVEKLALKVSIGRINQGELPLPNMSSVCILALARITGVQGSK